MIQVNIHEAKAKFSHLMQQVAKGERVVICKHNIPCMEWVPIAPQKRERQVGLGKGLITISEDCFDPMSEEELDEIESGHSGDPLRIWMERGSETPS